MNFKNIIRNVRDIDKCKNPGKVIAIAGALAAVTGLAYAAAKCIGNWIDSKIQNNADKKREDYRAEKAQETETHKAEEERTTKEAQAQAQADAYERMRKADAELYREKMEIDLEKRRRYQEFSQQAAQEQVNGDTSLNTVPNLRSSASVFTRSSGFGPKAWLVDGYAKPGQITLVVAGGGVGKSTLLLQIAKAVANGERAEFLPDSCCASLKQDVVYYRIEDFPDELEGKYGKGKVFDGLNIQWVLPEDLGVNSLSAFLDHVKRLAHKLERDTLVCVDPATKLDGHSHEACIKGLEDAQKIAKANSVTLSFIVAAHPDEINDWKPLTTEHIKGGDKGVQQAGAVIALRMEGTPGGNHRFIQCLKAPKGHAMPFPEGVLVCKYVKSKLDNDNWYLHFEYVEIKPETDARPEKAKANKAGNTSKPTADIPKKKGNTKLSEADVGEIIARINDGESIDDLAEEYGVNPITIRRRIDAKTTVTDSQEDTDQAA